ncbi:hypothetical protein RSAG8_12609, partial [Rhizoctonia solani AG-8 WAC10335]
MSTIGVGVKNSPLPQPELIHFSLQTLPDIRGWLWSTHEAGTCPIM